MPSVISLCQNPFGRLVILCLFSLALVAPGYAQSPEQSETRPQKIERVRMERMAAWQRTIVVSSELAPHSALLSYTRNNLSFVHHNLLLKIIPTVGPVDTPGAAAGARDLKVEDLAGGVAASFTLGGVRTQTEFVPLCVGQDSEGWEGAALYRIRTDPPTPVTLHLGEGTSLTQISGPSPELNGAELRPLHRPVPHGSQSMTFRGGIPARPLALSTSGALEVRQADSGGSFVTVAMPSGEGHVLVAFAEDERRLAEVAASNP